MSHFENRCIHGVVLGQCRCPSPDKVIHLVACPVGDVAHDKIADTEPAQSLATAHQSVAEALSEPIECDDVIERLERVTALLSEATITLNTIKEQLGGLP